MRHDSIRKKGLEIHVNQYCETHGIKYRFDDLKRWLEKGEYGEPVTKEWIRRRFAPISRPAFDKWVTIYEEEKKSGEQKKAIRS